MDIENYYENCASDLHQLDLHVSKEELNLLFSLTKEFPYGENVQKQDLILLLKYCSRERPSYHHFSMETGLRPDKVRLKILSSLNKDQKSEYKHFHIHFLYLFIQSLEINKISLKT